MCDFGRNCGRKFDPILITDRGRNSVNDVASRAVFWVDIGCVVVNGIKEPLIS